MGLGLGKLSFLFFSLLVLASAGYASTAQLLDIVEAAGKISYQNGHSGSPSHISIQIEAREIPAGGSHDEISAFIAEQTLKPNTQVVLSTDSAALLENTFQKADSGNQNLTLIPIETHPTFSDKRSSSGIFLQMLKAYGNEARTSIVNDKIGFLVLSFTTSAETLVWIHSTHLSEFERTGNIVYTVALALVFGLNKDKWAATTRPIQDFFFKTFGGVERNPAELKDLASRFLGNLALAAVVSSGRIPLLSMDEIINHGLQMSYFSTPLLLSLISTAAAFTWSEHLAMINQKTAPVAKFIFRRASEFRWVFLGTFATTASLLNPGQHGLAPWLILAGSGIAGATIYFNAKPILKAVETNAWLRETLAKVTTIPKNVKCEVLFL